MFDLGTLCARADALLRLTPYLMDLDWTIGSLDLDTGRQVLNQLRAVADRDGRTVLLVTHNAAIGGMGDKVVRLHSGELASIRPNERPLRAEEVEW